MAEPQELSPGRPGPRLCPSHSRSLSLSALLFLCQSLILRFCFFYFSFLPLPAPTAHPGCPLRPLAQDWSLPPRWLILQKDQGILRTAAQHAQGVGVVTLSPATAGVPCLAWPDLQELLLSPWASVTASDQLQEGEGTVSTQATSVFLTYLCRNQLLTSGQLCPSRFPIPSPGWIFEELSSLLPSLSRAQKSWKEAQIYSCGARSHPWEGAGTKRGACAPFNSPFWQKENLRSNFRAFDT